MSIKMTCNVCGDTYESSEIERVLSWSRSHDDSCQKPADRGSDDG